LTQAAYSLIITSYYKVG